MEIDVGAETHVLTWNPQGKRSFMPLQWILDDYADIVRTNEGGDLLELTPLGKQKAVAIRSRGYYQKSETTVVGAKTILTLWGGQPVQADLLRPGMQLSGMFGMFVVERADKVTVPLWRTNAGIALYIQEVQHAG